MNTSRDRDRERLERALQHDDYQQLLLTLQQQYSFPSHFETWAAVLAFMRSGTSRDLRKDGVLRPIFSAHQGDQKHHWRDILLAIFWPGLESIHRQKYRWDADPDDLWQNIVWTFLQIICRIDVGQRPERLVQKIFNDTVYHLHEEYCRNWAQQNREILMAPEEIEDLRRGGENIDRVGIELRDAKQKAINWLREFMAQGGISEADFHLFVGTRIYGNSLAEYARENGLKYRAAQKRLQRAQAKIHRFVWSEEELPNRCLTPSAFPPFLLEKALTEGGDG